MASSEKEIKRRCEAIRERMKEEGLECLVIFSQIQIGFAGAVRYFSNYHLTTRKEYLVLPLSGDPVLIVPTLGQMFFAKSNSWIEDVRSGGEAQGMIQEIVKTLRKTNANNHPVGIVGLNTTMPYYDYQLLERELPDIRFKDATELLGEIRMVKSKEEIDMIQQTTDIADLCYARLLEVLRVGRDEMEVMGEVDKVLIEHGVEDILILTAKGQSFPSFINHPGPYIFKENDHYIFSIEISGPSGYWSQIVRPVCLGKASAKYVRLFEVAKAALEIGLSNLAPGKTIGAVVGAVGDSVKKAGFKTGLWCGHGMGLDVAEEPGLFPDSTVEVKEGMVITVHPHVMYPDGEQGILLGDTFVVEKEGARNLSRSALNGIECV